MNRASRPNVCYGYMMPVRSRRRQAFEVSTGTVFFDLLNISNPNNDCAAANIPSTNNMGTGALAICNLLTAVHNTPVKIAPVQNSIGIRETIPCLFNAIDNNRVPAKNDNINGNKKETPVVCMKFMMLITSR